MLKGGKRIDNVSSKLVLGPFSLFYSRHICCTQEQREQKHRYLGELHCSLLCAFHRTCRRQIHLKYIWFKTCLSEYSTHILSCGVWYHHWSRWGDEVDASIKAHVLYKYKVRVLILAGIFKHLHMINPISAEILSNQTSTWNRQCLDSGQC